MSSHKGIGAGKLPRSGNAGALPAGRLPGKAAEPSPLADVEYTGDTAQDQAAELTALQRGFRERREKQRLRQQQINDTTYWCSLTFQSRAQRNAFLAALGLDRMLEDDQHLDGVAVAKKLGIELPPAEAIFVTSRHDPALDALAQPLE
jgi:hypothetical protein